MLIEIGFFFRRGGSLELRPKLVHKKRITLDELLLMMDHQVKAVSQEILQHEPHLVAANAPGGLCNDVVTLLEKEIEWSERHLLGWLTIRLDQDVRQGQVNDRQGIWTKLCAVSTGRVIRL